MYPLIAHFVSSVVFLFLSAISVLSLPQQLTQPVNVGTNSTRLSSLELGIDPAFDIEVIVHPESPSFENHVPLYGLAVKASAHLAALAHGERKDPITLDYPDVSNYELTFTGPEDDASFDVTVAIWGLFYLMQSFPTEVRIRECRVKLTLHEQMVGWIHFTFVLAAGIDTMPPDRANATQETDGRHGQEITDMAIKEDQNVAFFTSYSFGGARILIEDFYWLLEAVLVALRSREVYARFGTPILIRRQESNIRIAEVMHRSQEYPVLLNRYAIKMMDKSVDAAIDDRVLSEYLEFELSLWTRRPKELGKVNIWTVNAPPDTANGVVVHSEEVQ